MGDFDGRGSCGVCVSYVLCLVPFVLLDIDVPLSVLVCCCCSGSGAGKPSNFLPVWPSGTISPIQGQKV